MLPENQENTLAVGTAEPSSTFSSKQIVMPIVQIGVTAAAVSLALTPVGYLRMHWLFADKRMPFNQVFYNTVKPSSLFLNRQAIANVVINNTKGGFIKTGVRTPGVQEHVEGGFGESEAAQVKLNSTVEYVNQENDASRFKPRTSVSSLILMGCALGGFESLATNYYDNRSVFFRTGTVPTLDSMKARFQFFRTGLNTKFVRNSINAGFCLASTSMLQEQAERLFPKEIYGQTGATIGIITAGITSGLLTNMLDVVNKRQVFQVDTKTFKAQSALTVTKEVMATEGVRGFFRGASLSSLQTVIAFGTIHLVNKAFENLAAQENVTTTLPVAAARPVTPVTPATPAMPKTTINDKENGKRSALLQFVANTHSRFIGSRVKPNESLNTAMKRPLIKPTTPRKSS